MPPKPRIKCLNYEVCKFSCKEKYQMPEFPYCVECDCDMGFFKLTDEEKECSICLTNKKMIKIKCGHTLCSICWIKISKQNILINCELPCPFCRFNCGYTEDC